MILEAKVKALLCVPGDKEAPRRLHHGERGGKLPRAGKLTCFCGLFLSIKTHLLNIQNDGTAGLKSSFIFLF